MITYGYPAADRAVRLRLPEDAIGPFFLVFLVTPVAQLRFLQRGQQAGRFSGLCGHQLCPQTRQSNLVF